VVILDEFLSEISQSSNSTFFLPINTNSAPRSKLALAIRQGNGMPQQMVLGLPQLFANLVDLNQIEGSYPLNP
jgi:hypothetical protein